MRDYTRGCRLSNRKARAPADAVMAIFATTTLQRQPDQCVPRDRSQDRAGLVVSEFFVFHHRSVLMFVHMTFSISIHCLEAMVQATSD